MRENNEFVQLVQQAERATHSEESAEKDKQPFGFGSDNENMMSRACSAS